MFKCKICAEKDKQIEFLKAQNKDLYDRLMAFNKDAFTYYKAETKSGKALYPFAINEKGEVFDYKDIDPAKAKEEIFRAMGEEPITVEEKDGI